MARCQAAKAFALPAHIAAATASEKLGGDHLGQGQEIRYATRAPWGRFPSYQLFQVLVAAVGARLRNQRVRVAGDLLAEADGALDAEVVHLDVAAPRDARVRGDVDTALVGAEEDRLERPSLALWISKGSIVHQLLVYYYGQGAFTARQAYGILEVMEMSQMGRGGVTWNSAAMVGGLWDPSLSWMLTGATLTIQ